MSKLKILIVDDEENLRKLLFRIIQLEGYDVFEAANAKQALKILQQESIQVVISDVKLPDANGIELTAKLKSEFPSTEVIVLTAFGTISDGVQAIKNGAFDYLTKGDHQDKIIPLLQRATAKAVLQQKVEVLERKLTTKYGFENIIGSSKSIRQTIELAKKVAATNTTVLLTGETGTGKEVFAQAIHYESDRKSKPFLPVNCSTLGKEIMESELFGHKAGAFTGAIRDKRGMFEEANGGTIFLDEIGELSVELQAKLLRVLETGSFIKVGESKETHVDVRVIAATNRELKTEVEQHHFREDLYYRLSVFQIQLSPLRERQEDIEEITKFFIGHFSAKVNKKVSHLQPAFLKALKGHAWKGNIRELKNVIERAVILADDDELKVDYLPFDFSLSVDTSTGFDLETVEGNHIKKVLTFTRGNKTEAAKLLNIGLTTLYQKIKDYHL